MTRRKPFNIRSGLKTKRASITKLFCLEAQTGFEPVRTGVADHCLTTWLLRHIFDLFSISQAIFHVKKRILLFVKAPRVGLEPTTTRLTAECSTIELSRNKRKKRKLSEFPTTSLTRN